MRAGIRTCCPDERNHFEISIDTLSAIWISDSEAILIDLKSIGDDSILPPPMYMTDGQYLGYQILNDDHDW